jgi:type IX secretion system PorP/SprF family membrane protein
MKQLFLFGLFFILLINVNAQDVHFSQYNMSPLTVNPALTGQFNGCVRLNGNYRNQWSSILGKGAFNTMAASLDATLMKEKMGGNFFGVGLNFFNDKAGDLSYSTQAIGFSFSYSRILAKKKPMVVSLGFNGTNWQKSIDKAAIILEDPTEGVLISPNVSFMDFSVGAFVYHAPVAKFNYNFGFSITHLNKANQSLIKSTDEIGTKLQLHTGAYIMVSDAFTLIPNIYYINQLKARELNVNLVGKVLIDENGKSETAVYFGMGTRVANPSIDALIAYFRFDIARLSIGLSYDFNISQLHYVSNNQAGPELSLQYVIGCPKSKAVIYNKRKKIYCPKF